MSGHTPGPWRYEFDHPELQCMAHIVAGDEGIFSTSIATLYGPDDTREGTEPDARLIAAAPDLLQALVALVNELPFHIVDAGGLIQVQNARMAIAKATGKFP